ncbi:hypothetical protein P8452_31744 [Trifolium repens]|nr:hypothetical protein P8452_31744 [Trifolium repens]
MKNGVDTVQKYISLLKVLEFIVHFDVVSFNIDIIFFFWSNFLFVSISIVIFVLSIATINFLLVKFLKENSKKALNLTWNVCLDDFVFIRIFVFSLKVFTFAGIFGTLILLPINYMRTEIRDNSCICIEYEYIASKRLACFYSSKPQPHQFTILVRGTS